MRKRKHGYSELGLALLLVSACKDADNGEGGSSPVDEAKAEGRAACDRYLECTAATTPEAVGALLEGFGPEGTCWQTDEITAIDLCTQACTAGRANVAELFPDVGVCGECSSDQDCSDAKAGSRCDTDTSRCVACVSDDDCAEGACEPAKKTCVECAGDDDCAADEACIAATCGPKPVCTPGKERCTFDSGAVLEVCDDAGSGWKTLENCSAQGLTCSASGCISTAYGPCIGAADCPEDYNECIVVDNDHGYCLNMFTSCSSDLQCPVPTPNAGGYDVVCIAQVCLLDCQNAPCPPGMECAAGTCAWPL